MPGFSARLLRPLCWRCSTFRPIPSRPAIRAGLVGDHHAWRAGWLAQELLHCELLHCELLHCELLRCTWTLAVRTRASRTKPPQAVSIDGTNMALHLAVDRDHDQIDTTTCRRTEARADGSCWRRSGRTSEPNTAQTKRTILPAADFLYRPTAPQWRRSTGRFYHRHQQSGGDYLNTSILDARLTDKPYWNWIKS